MLTIQISELDSTFWFRIDLMDNILFLWSLSQRYLGLLLYEGKLPQQLDINQSRGVHLTMLVLHLFSGTRNKQPAGIIYPLHELIESPTKAMVGVGLIFVSVLHYILYIFNGSISLSDQTSRWWDGGSVTVRVTQKLTRYIYMYYSYHIYTLMWYPLLNN